MKKALSLLLAAVFLLFCGCGPNENEFKVHYFSGLGYDPEVSYPVITVLHNTDERDAFAASENKLVREALSDYNEKFFSDRIVFVLEIAMGSAAYRYTLEQVYEASDTITFLLQRAPVDGLVPDVMGSMTILVEMDKSWDCEPENIRIEYQ